MEGGLRRFLALAFVALLTPGPALGSVTPVYATATGQAAGVVTVDLYYAAGTAGGDTLLNGNRTKADKGVATALLATTYNPVLHLRNDGSGPRTFRIAYLTHTGATIVLFKAGLVLNGTTYPQVQLDSSTVTLEEGADVTVPAGGSAAVSITVRNTLLTSSSTYVLYVKDVNGGGVTGAYYLFVHVNAGGTVPTGGSSITDFGDDLRLKEIQAVNAN